MHYNRLCIIWPALSHSHKIIVVFFSCPLLMKSFIYSERVRHWLTNLVPLMCDWSFASSNSASVNFCLLTNQSNENNQSHLPHVSCRGDSTSACLVCHPAIHLVITSYSTIISYGPSKKHQGFYERRNNVDGAK